VKDNYDDPVWLDDEDKELNCAEFISNDLQQKLKMSYLSADATNRAWESGVEGVTRDMVDRANSMPAKILEYICRLYTFEAIQRGSVVDKINLEKYFAENKEI
jgi:hypothetical protein